MKQTIALLILVLLSATCQLTFANAAATTGAISEVTVYRGQALVTRSLDLEVPSGSSEIVVTGLPHQIVSESLYAQASGDAMVLSVRYREQAVQEDTREEVKQLDAKIEDMNRQIKHTQKNLEHGGNLRGRYEPFWNLSTTTANHDFDRALLQYEPIEKLTGYLEGKMTQLHENALNLEDQLEDLQKELNLLQRQREELAAGRSRTEREAVLNIHKSDDKKTAIQLSYLVNDADWLPQYNLRADAEQTKVQVEYNAIIHQASGENWDGVTLRLSTAEPSMAAFAPALDPMKVLLGSGVSRGGRSGQEANKDSQPVAQQMENAPSSSYLDLSGEFKNIQQNRRVAAGKGKIAQQELNQLATLNQAIELQVDDKALGLIQKQAKEFARKEGVSVSYQLAGKLSLPSRSDQQLVTIARIDAGAAFCFVATPLLTDYVYLQAEMVNDSDTILLPGPASLYRGSDFVGKGEMPLVTMGEKFTAGFGVDSQIQVTREFKDKKIETLWGNRVDTYQYRIALQNYKKTPVPLRLLERLPYTEDESLAITDWQSSAPLSENTEYVANLKDKGILRWDLTLAPDTTGEKATVVTYSYTMKYDNDMHVISTR